MKKVKLLLIGLMVLNLGLVIAPSTYGKAGKHGRHKKSVVIVGQNNPGVDLEAIQEAVTNFSMVKLKGVFDIGPEGSIELSRNVSISGIRKNNPATIRGGTMAFYADDPDLKIKISNIIFDGAAFCAIRIRQCKYVNIEDNDFINIIGGENYGEQGDLYYDAVGIIIGGKRVEYEDSRSIYCSNIVISNNHFDMGKYNEIGELVERDVGEYPESSRAIRLYHMVVEKALIKTNEVVNYNRIAFDNLDAAGLPAGKPAIIRIEHNDIQSGPFAARGGWSSTEKIGSSFAMHCIGGYSSPDNDNVIFVIIKNKIKVFSTNSHSYNTGIFLFPATSNSWVVNNVFELGQNTNCGIMISWLSVLGSPLENQPHDNFVWGNKFSGTVTPALISDPSGVGDAVIIPGGGVFLSATRHNKVVYNDFTELELVPKMIGPLPVSVSPAHIFLTGSLGELVYPAENNFICGRYGIVRDYTDDLTTSYYDGSNIYKGQLIINGQ